MSDSLDDLVAYAATRTARGEVFVVCAHCEEAEMSVIVSLKTGHPVITGLLCRTCPGLVTYPVTLGVLA